MQLNRREEWAGGKSLPNFDNENTRAEDHIGQHDATSEKERRGCARAGGAVNVLPFRDPAGENLATQTADHPNKDLEEEERENIAHHLIVLRQECPSHPPI